MFKIDIRSLISPIWGPSAHFQLEPEIKVQGGAYKVRFKVQWYLYGPYNIVQWSVRSRNKILKNFQKKNQWKHLFKFKRYPLNLECTLVGFAKLKVYIGRVAVPYNRPLLKKKYRHVSKRSVFLYGRYIWANFFKVSYKVQCVILKKHFDFSWTC